MLKFDKRRTRSRKAEKRVRRAHRNEVVAATRLHVFDRDRCCRCCLAPGRDTDEMHEVESRAKLRGQPPERIFNTANCVRLCTRCHQQLTAHQLTIEARTDAGCDGELAFLPQTPKPRFRLDI